MSNPQINFLKLFATENISSLDPKLQAMLACVADQLVSGRFDEVSESQLIYLANSL